jgi:hypothetical protein
LQKIFFSRREKSFSADVGKNLRQQTLQNMFFRIREKYSSADVGKIFFSRRGKNLAKDLLQQTWEKSLSTGNM